MRGCQCVHVCMCVRVYVCMCLYNIGQSTALPALASSLPPSLPPALPSRVVYSKQDVALTSVKGLIKEPIVVGEIGRAHV